MANAAAEFRKYRTPLFRVWHWLNALALFGLMATAALRKTFLSWRTNAKIIQDQIAEIGTTVPDDVARKIAVTIREPMWDLHYVFGFALVALFVGRVAMAFMPGQPGILAEAKAALGGGSAHKKLVKVGYVVFYAVVTYMAVSGVLLYFKSDIGLAKEIAGNLKEIHEYLMWFFFGFSALHLAGVVFVEVRQEPGLVSEMLSGGQRE